ncbi:hypothetical protein JPSP17_17030 [Staphylococcus pseudintermedius]
MIALKISVIGEVGIQIIKKRLTKARKKPEVSTTLAPKRFNTKPTKKFVIESAIKCMEIAIEVILTAMVVAVGNKGK